VAALVAGLTFVAELPSGLVGKSRLAAASAKKTARQ
jgi:hypothetical protein